MGLLPRIISLQNSPSGLEKLRLKSNFWETFGSPSGYEQLDERKKLTLSKISELLLVLEHPELPLHNNPAELAARKSCSDEILVMQPKLVKERRRWTFSCLWLPQRSKLGISFFEYMNDRISHLGNIPSLGMIIRQQSSVYSLGVSWSD
ncbi:hypothetical protein QUA56_02150 [Microcoleus sp. N3A4]|uniref:hypothetical protein n=1 Tax=Microcoleus sp. N3A4 TaxID=3055379 RepID=UPI002FD6C42A